MRCVWSDGSCSEKGVKQEVTFVFSLRSPTRIHKQPKRLHLRGREWGGVGNIAAGGGTLLKEYLCNTALF